ncbi:MAG TPA: type II secretion system F family protein [Nitrospiraceae bacterium]|nr:type II secretion system F family protein [Nitrospiraceae bacterium]
MPIFSYRAIDSNGTIVKGVTEGMDIDNAYNSIASTGLYVIDIKKSNEYIASIKKRLLAKRIKRSDIIEFASNLSVMLKAGIPLLSALSDIAEATENRYFKQPIDSIRSTVELGSRFSDAVALQKHIFPDIFVRLAMVGEETGQFDKSLSDVAEHLQKMDDLAAAIKRALIYPAFAIVTTTGALLFWLIYVLPQVIDVFKDMDMVLPLPTRILIFISSFTQSYGYLILLSPVILFVLIKVLKQKKETRYYIDLAKIKFPIMKHIIYNKLLALFSEQLRILTTAGITINRSFEITADVIGNDVFKTAIEDSNQAISGGSRISDALRKHKVFPPLAIRMIDIGETSGTLDEQFTYLSEYYLKKLDAVTEKLGKMIEPIVIGVVGLMFALIIIGLLFPVYDLVAKMGR